MYESLDTLRNSVQKRKTGAQTLLGRLGIERGY